MLDGEETSLPEPAIQDIPDSYENNKFTDKAKGYAVNNK
jgi:hypothetical protein